MGRSLLAKSFPLFCAVLLWAAGEIDEELLAAARKGDLAAVRAALEKGAVVDAKTRHGVTPLFYAAQNGHAGIVEFLLDKGADINVKDTFYGMSALQRAAGQGQAAVVKLMIERGAAGAEGALTGAIFANKIEVVKAILDSGKASREALSRALAAAQNSSKTEIIELLKKAGAIQAEPPRLVTVEPAILRRYEGRYEDSRGNVVVLKVENDKLTLTPAGGGPIALNATGPTTFVPSGTAAATMRMVVSGDTVSGLEIEQLGAATTFKKAAAQ